MTESEKKSSEQDKAYLIFREKMKLALRRGEMDSARFRIMLKSHFECPNPEADFVNAMKRAAQDEAFPEDLRKIITIVMSPDISREAMAHWEETGVSSSDRINKLQQKMKDPKKRK